MIVVNLWQAQFRDHQAQKKKNDKAKTTKDN